MTKTVLDLHAAIPLNLYTDRILGAIVLSLFCDARGTEADDSIGRGWWGDDLAAEPYDRWGSRLWELARSKHTAETLRRAEDYARAALAWMIEDGVADKITVTALARPAETLGLLIRIDGQMHELHINHAD